MSLALERFRTHGFRVTDTRVKVLCVLAEAHQPLTPYGIHDHIVADAGQIDIVSVYRTLQALSVLGLVHHIGVVDGYMPCRLDGEHVEHAEHLVCEKCGKVVEVPFPDEALTSVYSQLAMMIFRPTTVKVEVTGRCQACAQED